MKIGIHQPDGGYGKYWIAYCIEKNIPYKIVNCYSTDIISDLSDCDALMWHHNHANPKDTLFAKELLISVEASGKLVYPNTNTTWFFNDKLGQKYLFEALSIPLVPTYVFFSRAEALDWISGASWPLVFKLRGGAGSRNVRLIKSKKEAKKIIKKAFGKGIRQYDAPGGLKESFRRFRMGKASFKGVLKSLAHFVYPIQLERSKGREKGYVYFQKFIPECKYDIRVQVVGEKIWAMIRSVRENDFKASGSGKIESDPEKIPVKVLKLSMDIVKKLNLQSAAIDFLPTDGGFLITEISYAFGIGPEDTDIGYWDSNLVWYPGKMNPFGWMVDLIIERFHAKMGK
jgi:glutathione synthase/RimK-type ligase-like ATP-grasp enzyme